VVLFPNAKINLGLNILRKRPDGYHDLETVFYPLAIQDALEVVKNDNTKEDIRISLSGIPIDGKTEENLCFKAYWLLKRDLPQLPGVMIHLHKTIPAGSGLGGGSADGAFMLKLLNQKFDLGLSTEQMLDHASRLGSDCPFFIINKPCVATGRGEFLEPISVDLSEYKFVIANAGIHVSTTEAFSLLNPSPPSKSIKEIIQQPIETWKAELKNDFEGPVFKKYPAIETIKAKMYGTGAVYSSMTGSGSSVYGIFRKELEENLDLPSNYFVKELISQF
jgi:4-diphosphocytidyl-2-C-methyl-D-erythritol kinase